MRSAVALVSEGRGQATNAQTRSRYRSTSRRVTSGSGVRGQREEWEQQRRLPATRAGPSGVQPVVVRTEENSDRSEGELSGGKDQGHPAAVDSGVSAGGPSPGKPGECTSLLSISTLLKTLLDQGRQQGSTRAGGAAGPGGDRPHPEKPRDAGFRTGSVGLQDLLACLRDLVQRFEPSKRDSQSPAQAWAPAQGKDHAATAPPLSAVAARVIGDQPVTLSGPVTAVVDSPVLPASVLSPDTKGKAGEKKADSVRLAYSLGCTS